MEKVIHELNQKLHPIDLNCRIALKEDIIELQRLDNIVFGLHQSVSKEELAKVIENGFILIVENQQKEIIGQSQVLLDSSEILKHPLSSSQAYAYGTGILNEYQGKGLGSLLRKGQIFLAIENDKDQILATCRLENYYSLKSLHRLGYYGNILYKNYYDKLENGGARISLCKPLKEDFSPVGEEVSVPIEFEGSINIETYEIVHELFHKNFVLTDVHCAKSSLMYGQLIFKKKN